MNIAHVLGSFGMGGGEVVALHLAAGQRRLGHHVLAVNLAAKDGALGPTFRSAGAEVHQVTKRPGFDVRLPWRLLALFRRASIDVVHTHNPLPLIYAAPAGRLARATVVHTKHGDNVDLRVAHRHWLRRGAAELVDAFVAVSTETAQTARDYREMPTRKLTVIDNGIDMSPFVRSDATDRAAVRAELGLPDDAWVIGTVGRLEPIKQQSLLLRAAAPLLGPGCWLILVGDGPERAALEAQAEAAGVSGQVVFTGLRRDVPRVMGALDTFALSSEREGLPLVVLEAMAAGLPVVSVAVGGIPQVIDHGRTGLLATPDDEASLRAELKVLVDDRARARSMGAAAAVDAQKRYSAERMVGDYLDLYARLKGGANAATIRGSV